MSWLALLLTCSQMVTDEVVSRRLRALADVTRRQILIGLGDGERPAGRIAADFRISRPAVSRHLAVLRRAGLVREERRGRERWYRLRPAALDELAHGVAWLASGSAEPRPTSPSKESAADDEATVRARPAGPTSPRRPTPWRSW